MTNHRLRSLLGACAIASTTAQSQPSVSAPAALPSCAEDLEGLKTKLETDYAGYVLEVKRRPERYLRAVETLRAHAEKTTGEACFFVLREFVRWFDDPHLFIYQNAQLDSLESKRRSEQIRTISTDEPRAREYFRRNLSVLDPIEGIWYDGALRVAILRDSAAASGRYVAVVLTPDSANWKPGAVRARFTRLRDGYDAEVSLRDYSSQRLEARIHKHVMLRLSPGIWGKEYPAAAQDRGLLDPINPHRPTVLVRGGTVIVSIPSHDPTYRGAFDSLMERHAAALRTADRLIVDLRGNEGGSAQMTDQLVPYLASEHQPPSALAYRNTTMLSSPDQIRYASVAFGNDSTSHVRRLLDRLRAHPGEIVPLFDSLDARVPADPDSVIRGPRRVGVLIDHGTVSASEVLVLEAKRSRRVTVFGEPTAGALYYQSTSIVWVSPRERRWGLGFPTQIAGEWTPGPGTRRHGIAPHVRINLATVRDPIAVVEAALRKR